VQVYINLDPLVKVPVPLGVESAVVRKGWMENNADLSKWQEDLGVITLMVLSHCNGRKLLEALVCTRT
jgi:hypothetical protein